MALLLTLLVGEVALVGSLRTVGWRETGGAIRWISCLTAAVLPLLVAVAIFFHHRFRFSLQMLLIAVALTATFLFITVRPLQNALSSRRASRLMLAAGATLHTTSSWDSVYAQLKYDPRLTKSLPSLNQQLPFWLRPLAGNMLAVPVDDAVREIWLDNDEQISALCNEKSSFRNLERISVGMNVTKAALETLRQNLPKFAHLTDMELLVDGPADWLKSLKGVRTLVLTIPYRAPPKRLSDEQLRVVAALPELRVLEIFRYANTDADIQILSSSKTLKHLILKKTTVTQAGKRQLSAALPGCLIHRDLFPIICPIPCRTKISNTYKRPRQPGTRSRRSSSIGRRRGWAG
jgi:hypothetical protein